MKRFEYDLEKAFAPMPAQFHEAIEIAFERGDQEMKKRRKITALLAAAAVFAVVFAVGALAANNLYTPQPDHVVIAQGENAQVVATPPPQETLTPRITANPTLTPKPTPTPTPMPTPGTTAYAVPDFVSDPVWVEDENNEIVTNEKVHFYQGDFADPYALYILLGNAYYAHLRENGLNSDCRVIYTAPEELAVINDTYTSGKEEWSISIRETLQSVLDFSDDFIAEHFLINDITACLDARRLGSKEEFNELTPVLTAVPQLQPAGETTPESTYTPVPDPVEEINGLSE